MHSQLRSPISRHEGPPNLGPDPSAALMQGFDRGELPASERLLTHLDRCLDKMYEIERLRKENAKLQRRAEVEVPGISLSTVYRTLTSLEEQGVILRPLGNPLVINPPLAISDHQVASIVRALRHALDQVSGGQRSTQAFWRIKRPSSGRSNLRASKS